MTNPEQVTDQEQYTRQELDLYTYTHTNKSNSRTGYKLELPEVQTNNTNDNVHNIK